MNSAAIKAIIVFVVSLFVALYLGIAAATAQMELILWIVGCISIVICLLLGRHIWLLIPLFGAVNISFQIPGQPNTLMLAQIMVIGFSCLLFLLRRITYRPRLNELEIWCCILSIMILQAYVRNPVGLNIFGGSTIGGKDYVIYTITFLSTLLLCGLRVDAKDLKWILPLSIIGGLVNLSISIIGIFSPIIGQFTGTSDMKSLSSEYNDEAIDESAATRIGFLGNFGNNLAQWISAYISPLKACFRPLWAILILTAIVTAGMSGFRNIIASVGMTLLLGIAYRSGFRGVMISIFCGICGIALLAVVNNIHPLPPNVQRSLTILPGTWEERYKEDAKGSTEWRIEIWNEALNNRRWIQNKWLGDGLGFSATELAAQANLRAGARAGLSGLDAHRESILANGDYHSGPVSTIRTIGYVGLVVIIIGWLRLAMRAHQQILRCRDTEWYPTALFIGIPIIWGPFFWIFIFGSFGGGASSLLLGTAMIRILENNLPLPAYAGRRHVTLPMVTKKRLTSTS